MCVQVQSNTYQLSDCNGSYPQEQTLAIATALTNNNKPQRLQRLLPARTNFSDCNGSYPQEQTLAIATALTSKNKPQRLQRLLPARTNFSDCNGSDQQEQTVAIDTALTRKNKPQRLQRLLPARTNTLLFIYAILKYPRCNRTTVCYIFLLFKR